MTAKSIVNDPQQIEFILHVGDISYADGDQSRWDSWGNAFEFLSAKTPWMTLPGNHENEFRAHLPDPFIAYRTRFRMPSIPKSNDRNLYWSFDFSYLHIVALSSETEFSSDSDQFKWFINDMEKVNRTKTPWIIVMFHRPYYNSNHGMIFF